jgi:hypothetical protein
MKKTLLSVIVFLAMSSFTLLNAQNSSQAREIDANPIVTETFSAQQASKSTQVLYFEGFETLTDPPANLPVGWTIKRTTTLDAEPTLDAVTPRWVRLDLVHNLVFTGGVTANQPYVRTDNSSMVTGYTAPDFTWAISPSIVIPANLGNSTALEFWTWYTNVGGSGPYPTNYFVKVHADGVWSTVFSMVGTVNVPNNIYTSALSVTLGAYEGKTIKLAFVYQYTDGYQMAIDDIKITATPPPPNHQVTFSVVGGNGAIAASVNAAPITSPASVEQGKDVVFTATPAANFRVKEWKLNGTLVAGNTTNTYTLANLQAAAAVTVEFEAIPPPVHQVTLRVDMTPATGFVPATHKVYIAGGFPAPNGWNEPGSNSNLELARVDQTMIWSITLGLPAGSYPYKFFANHVQAGWNGGEWAGDPNRSATIAGDVTLNHVWGQLNTSVDDIALDFETSVFPNPVRGILTVQSQQNIDNLRLLDMSGRQVYNVNVNGFEANVDVRNLNQGLYILQIISGTQVKTHKIQVER